MNDMTTDEMITYLEKAMKEKHHPDWLGWVRQNKVFKYKTISIDSVSPADGWEGDQNKIDNMAKSDLNNAPLIVVHKDGTMIDGNHRHQALKKQGAQTVKAYVGESKMDLKLVDNEISEARLYRTTRNFEIYNGREIADLLYLTSLATFMMAKDEKQEAFARSYAKQTAQYGKYNFFRSHATDLYLLAYQVSDPDNRNIKLKSSIESKRFLKSCKFNDRHHWNFFTKLGQGRENSNDSVVYFMRLEKQLKISNAKYKQFRRFVTDWKNLKYRSKQLVVTQMIQEFRRIGRGSEMISPLSTMTRYKSYRMSDKYKKQPSTAKRVAGAAAGAVAGRYAGKKIAQKLGKDVDKYKKAGTGIGAIAGYWASGRQRQK
jgi:hypothetical protein